MVLPLKGGRVGRRQLFSTFQIVVNPKACPLRQAFFVMLMNDSFYGYTLYPLSYRLLASFGH